MRTSHRPESLCLFSSVVGIQKYGFEGAVGGVGRGACWQVKFSRIVGFLPMGALISVGLLREGAVAPSVFG